MSSIMIGHAVRRYLAVPLSKEEVDERLQKVAVMVGAVEDRELVVKEEAKKAKEGLDKMREEIGGLSKEARERSQYRDVKCVWRADYTRGEARLERTDTGHVVETRGLTEAEMQTRLPVFENPDAMGDGDEPPPMATPKSPRARRKGDEART